MAKRRERQPGPCGGNPKTGADSLLRIIETGKKLCLAPIAAAGAYGVALLSQAEYVGALLTVVTGAVMTLILIGTISVGDFLVRYLIHWRSRFDTPNTSSKPKRRRRRR